MRSVVTARLTIFVECIIAHLKAATSRKQWRNDQWSRWVIGECSFSEACMHWSETNLSAVPWPSNSGWSNSVVKWVGWGSSKALVERRISVDVALHLPFQPLSWGVVPLLVRNADWKPCVAERAVLAIVGVELAERRRTVHRDTPCQPDMCRSMWRRGMLLERLALACQHYYHLKTYMSSVKGGRQSHRIIGHIK